jgi:hypothetical protein
MASRDKTKAADFDGFDRTRYLQSREAVYVLLIDKTKKVYTTRHKYERSWRPPGQARFQAMASFPRIQNCDTPVTPLPFDAPPLQFVIFFSDVQTTKMNRKLLRDETVYTERRSLLYTRRSSLRQDGSQANKKRVRKASLSHIRE